MIAGSVAQGELIQQNDEASRDEVVTKSERIVSEYLERLRQDPSFSTCGRARDCSFIRSF